MTATAHRLLALSATLAAAVLLAPGLTGQWLAPTGDLEPDEVIVRIEDGAATPIEEIGEMIGALSHRSLFHRKIWLLELQPGSNVRAAARRLEALSAVRYAHPNVILRATGIPDDPDFSLQWGLDQPSDADIDAPEAWDLQTDASGVVVAVIDTGVDYNHVDLAANIWTNAGEIPGNGVDDDGNGYIDDIHGYDWVNNDADPQDDNSHGTHCSGIIGAETDNATGVAGVCWQVQIMALKFLNSGGSGSIADAILAVEYSLDNGANLSSNSYGCYCSASDMQGLYDAVDLAGDQGMLFVAAAGNDNLDNDVNFFYPASFDLPEVLAVAASDSSDNKASFSNYGATTVDVGAPGRDIYSTIPGSYGYKSGTSMACPQVAGCVALISAYCPWLALIDIKQVLIDTVDVLPGFTGKVVSDGRINLRAALDACPSPVTLTVLQPDGGELIYGPSYDIQWSWTDPAGQIDHVTLFLQDGTGNDLAVLADGEANDGLYPWDASGEPDGSYRIRIEARDASSSALASDNSDAPFRIDRSTTVSVISPDGGELFYATHDITWTAVDPDGEIDHIRLILLDAQGQELATIADGEANDGLYSWDTTGVSDGLYLIGIEARNGSGQVLGTDRSDASFRVDHSTVVGVLSPNGGETIETKWEVTWSAVDADGEIASIDLWLQDRSGNDLQEIATGESNDGAYSWDASRVPMGRYRLAVIARNAAGQVLGRDGSDGPFVIGLRHPHNRIR